MVLIDLSSRVSAVNGGQRFQRRYPKPFVARFKSKQLNLFKS